jgi:hypothetical protein
VDNDLLKSATSVFVAGIVAIAVMSISFSISHRAVVAPCECPKIVATQEGEICCKGLPKHDYEMTDAEKVQYKVKKK